MFSFGSSAQLAAHNITVFYFILLVAWTEKEATTADDNKKAETTIKIIT